MMIEVGIAPDIAIGRVKEHADVPHRVLPVPAADLRPVSADNAHTAQAGGKGLHPLIDALSAIHEGCFFAGLNPWPLSDSIVKETPGR